MAIVVRPFFLPRMMRRCPARPVSRCLLPWSTGFVRSIVVCQLINTTQPRPAQPIVHLPRAQDQKGGAIWLEILMSPSFSDHHRLWGIFVIFFILLFWSCLVLMSEVAAVFVVDGGEADFGLGADGEEEEEKLTVTVSTIFIKKTFETDLLSRQDNPVTA